MEVINNIIDIDYFISFKKKSECLYLNDDTLKIINVLFSNKNKNKKKILKKNNHILKNQKIQNQKDNLSNKINLILNKLSENNIDTLTNEFINNINKINNDEFEEIQKTFYLKIISEINFIKIYLNFFKNIAFIYNKVQNYNISYFISIIETKFKYDYMEIDIKDDKYIFLKEIVGEIKRINNLIFIKELVELNILKNDIINMCTNNILNQKLYISDIYYWFININLKLTNNEILKIKEILTYNFLSQRDKVLLENIINNSDKGIINKIDDNIIIKNENIEINNNKLELECINIIEEYLLIKSLDDVIYYINKYNNDKNNLCYYILDQYFLLNKDKSNELFNLLKILIKNNVLNKNNLSKGLLLINDNWKEKFIDYSNSNNKMINILLYLGKSNELDELFKLFIK